MSIPGFDQLREVRRTGLASVYSAREVATGRRVCLEVLRLGPASDIPYYDRLRRKLEAVATLDHPNIWPILWVGEDARSLLQVRPWFDGPMLDQALRDQRPAPRQAAEWARQLALAAQHAHEHGIFHCDLKPSNVLLREEAGQGRVPLLTGFDCARVHFLPVNLEEPRAVMIVGTPAYMAPEQAQGHWPGHEASADVWGLGVMLYEMLSGSRPFQGRTVLDILQSVLGQEPVPVQEAAAGIDEELARVCMRCLRKPPQQRYASAAELADDLGRYLRGEPLAPAEQPPPRRGLFGRWFRGRRGQSS